MTPPDFNLPEIPSVLNTVADVGDVLGKGISAVGGVLGAVAMGTDIAEAVKEKRISFDNAMHMADDATSIATAVTAFTPRGLPLTLALMGGEKFVTGIIKGVKAVEDKKKEEGVEHLKPGEWLETLFEANVPAWMLMSGAELKEAHKEKKAEKKQAKAEDKRYLASLTPKERRKEKVRRFFFG
jgi:hypothetical protein